MVLPLIPLALIGTGVLTGGAGVFNGASGANKLAQARRTAAEAQGRFEQGLASTNAAVEETNDRIRSYGDLQQETIALVITRMIEFLRRIERQASHDPKNLLDGLEADVRQEFDQFGGPIADPVDVLAGAAKAGFTRAAAYSGIPMAVGALGTASTGTAIGGLSGVAAQNATMAWLGGGSLASGGGGMALGATALNVVTVGPTLLVGGLMLNSQGEKAVTRAREFVAEVNVALTNQKQFRGLLQSVAERVAELTRVLQRLRARAIAALDLLESEDWDPAQHQQRLQDALRLTFAVRDLVATPVLDDDGVLNQDTLKLILKYKEAQ